jgi:hypothetical protein
MSAELAALSADATAINRMHQEICSQVKSALNKAIDLGGRLANIKSKLPHGQWLPWIKSHLEFSDQTARNYIKVWANRSSLNSKGVLNLADAYADVMPAKKKEPSGDWEGRCDLGAELESFIETMLHVSEMVHADFRKPFSREKDFLQIECAIRRDWWINPIHEVKEDFIFVVCTALNLCAANWMRQGIFPPKGKEDLYLYPDRDLKPIATSEQANDAHKNVTGMIEKMMPAVKQNSNNN